MRKITTILAALCLISTVLPVGVFTASAQTSTGGISNNWVVVPLFQEKPGVKIESYKLDRGLAAWTTVSGGLRKLYVNDGKSTSLLATMPVGDWTDPDHDAFYDPIAGNYDVADGLVVWSARNGVNRSIFSFDGFETKIVSSNGTDNVHPVTGQGRIAWTSFNGGAYNLVVREPNGRIRSLASYNVMNYAMSGSNLFWLNRLPDEDWFRVFADNGAWTSAIGQGDDRGLRQYFFTDGKGSAAWEYSTKNWSYDKRIVYVSPLGGQAVVALQRDVPPNITRVEDVRGGEVAVNSLDLLYTRLYQRNGMIRSTGFDEQTIDRAPELAKMRFLNDCIVRHTDPAASSALMCSGDVRVDVPLLPVIHDEFDANGPTGIAAMVSGGVYVFSATAHITADESLPITSVLAKNGDVAWIANNGGAQALSAAYSTVLVRKGDASKMVVGHLMKAAGSHSVYLVSNDGRRYAFASEGVYHTWFDTFGGVRTVSAKSIAMYPIAGNVDYRPGSTLVRVGTESSQLYAAAQDGKLYPLIDTSVAEAAFGAAWPTMVDTINIPLMPNYLYGRQVESIYDYNAVVNGVR